MTLNILNYDSLASYFCCSMTTWAITALAVWCFPYLNVSFAQMCGIFLGAAQVGGSLSWGSVEGVVGGNWASELVLRIMSDSGATISQSAASRMSLSTRADSECCLAITTFKKSYKVIKSQTKDTISAVNQAEIWHIHCCINRLRTSSSPQAVRLLPTPPYKIFIYFFPLVKLCNYATVSHYRIWCVLICFYLVNWKEKERKKKNTICLWLQIYVTAQHPDNQAISCRRAS